MKNLADLLLTVQKIEIIKRIISRLRPAPKKRDFEPLPSYWALIPLDRVKNMDKKGK